MRSLCFGVRVLWRAIPLGLARFIPPHLRCALLPSRCPPLARALPCSPLEATEKGTFFWTPLPHFLLSFSPAGGETGLRYTGSTCFHHRADGPLPFSNVPCSIHRIIYSGRRHVPSRHFLTTIFPAPRRQNDPRCRSKIKTFTCRPRIP
jgi:hypothetical protein